MQSLGEPMAAGIGPIWDRVGVAFQQKKHKTPAKRITTDARSWVAANANRGPLN